jgi:hypothetical protein
MPRFAMRLTPELLETVESYTGAGSTESLNDVSFIVLTPLASNSFNLTFMSEDQVFAEFATDSNIQLIG